MNFTGNKLRNELDMAESSNLVSGIHDVRCPHLIPRKPLVLGP